MNTSMTLGGARLSVARMLDDARTEAGLRDFGDDEPVQNLEHLVEAFNEVPELSAAGLLAFQAEVQRMLVNLLRFTDDVKRHPEILDEELDDPVVILGLPRTGTTKLHRMLSADPGFQCARFWQLLNPAPLPQRSQDGEDARLPFARQVIEAMRQHHPGLLQSHPIQADDADEEVFLQMLSFKSVGTYMSNPAPRYMEWLSTQSLQSSYRFLKRMLQYLQWQGGGRRGRAWVLKTPVHLGHLDLLLESFPRATLVCTHREPREIIPSFCRLT